MTKRPKVALGARFLTAGVAASGTLGLVAVMQNHENQILASMATKNTTPSTLPPETVPTTTGPQVIVIQLDLGGQTSNSPVNQITTSGTTKVTGATSGVKPATPTTVKQGGTTTPTTALPAPTTVAPTTTLAPAPCVTTVSGKCK